MKTPRLNLVVIAGLLASISGVNAGDVADKPAVLSVTWFVEGQPPATTNTPMSSLKACLLAKAHAEAAGEQAHNERIRLNEQDKADVLEGRVSKADEKGYWQEAPGVYAVDKEGQPLKPRPPKKWVVTELSSEAKRKLKGVAPPQLSAFCIEQ
ncbi:hypothetical protein FXV83_16270 [Bradyrhizobium hipponense]|uniref:Uncharacterized protein n=1 Tax=Bradyrhizobium hipponense TaxID=2605638 RepID=A0A5S4YMA4_9BRAD|nr:hypothetical protein [Bradyrhizobium hipponense]TYO65490.1 hypothetical protein FXV83_16270 [Bradyrhizobium hipponense]